MQHTLTRVALAILITATAANSAVTIERIPRPLYQIWQLVVGDRAVHLEIQRLQIRAEYEDDVQHELSIWCVREQRSGLSLAWPEYGHGNDVFQWLGGSVWINETLIGLWRLRFQPRGFHVWASDNRTQSIDAACELGLETFRDNYEEIRRRSQKPFERGVLTGHSIDLEAFLEDDAWSRGAPSSSFGGPPGSAQIDRIVRNDSGWRVHVTGLEDIHYEIDIDDDLELIGAKRTTGSFERIDRASRAAR